MTDDLSANPNIHALTPTRKRDEELAEEIRKEIVNKLIDLCLTLDQAKDNGFVVSFQLGFDWRQKQIIQSLIIAKHY